MATSVKVNIMSPLDVGHVLIIGGIVKNHAETFKIQLLNEGEANSAATTSLQIEANLSDNVFRLQSGSDGRDEEETYKFSSTIITSFFKFHILALDDKFRIALNDEHLCSFSYRYEVSAIKLIEITGDIECIKQVDHRQIYPYCWPQNHQDLPTIAFSADVPCRFSQNTVIVLGMTLMGDQNGSFFIRFNELGSKKQLFHFNPRFNEKVIVCNSMNDHLEWQTEMRNTNFPFVFNKEFRMGILLGSTSFKVAVNGNHILEFPINSHSSNMLRVFESNPIYDKLTGFKIFALNDLQVRVNFVDFFSIKENDAALYENFTRFEF